MEVVVGVDPGTTGAASIMVNGLLRDVVDMPAAAGAGSSSTRVQPAMLAEVVRQWLIQWPAPAHEHVAVIEAVGAMPGQGVHSVFSFGHSLGAVEGVFSAMGMRVEWVTPAKWKAALGLTVKAPRLTFADKAEQQRAKNAKRKASKDAARAMASRLYPAEAHRWMAASKDGRAEAVLLAHWWTHVRRADASQ